MSNLVFGGGPAQSRVVNGRNEHCWERVEEALAVVESAESPLYFNRLFGFPLGFGVKILKLRPCQGLEEICYRQAVWLPSLCVGVYFHDFCNCPSIGETYTYDWQLITHPKDYSGEMEGKHSQVLKLSKVNLPPVLCRAGLEVLTIF